MMMKMIKCLLFCLVPTEMSLYRIQKTTFQPNNILPQ